LKHELGWDKNPRRISAIKSDVALLYYEARAKFPRL